MARRRAHVREHVRQELRGSILLDAVEQHKTAGLPDEEAVTKAMEEFGRPEDLRPELEATHGHRMLAVLIDRALQWKERTMRAKWMWSSWAYLTLSLVIALELLFIAFNVYFIIPKFQGLLYDGFIDGEFLRKLGGSWMLTFLDRLETVEQKYGWSILLAAAAAIGLFEWRVKGENKSLMRFSALGTSALGLFLVVIVMTVSLVVTFCLAASRKSLPGWSVPGPWSKLRASAPPSTASSRPESRRTGTRCRTKPSKHRARQSVWHADRPSFRWWVGVHRPPRSENCETMCTPRLRTFGRCKKRFAKRTKRDSTEHLPSGSCETRTSQCATSQKPLAGIGAASVRQRLTASSL